MKNYKTTIGGLLAAIGLSLTAMDNPTLKMTGTVLAAIGTFLTGTGAKDFDKTGV